MRGRGQAPPLRCRKRLPLRRLALGGRLPGLAAVIGHLPLERLGRRGGHRDRVLRLDELAAHLVLARPVPGGARHRAARLSHHPHTVETHVLVDLLLAVPADDGLALHLAHRAFGGFATDELPSALEPRALLLAGHLAAGAPGPGLHRRLGLPLSGEGVELLRLRTGLGRFRVLVGQSDAGTEAQTRQNRHRSAHRHAILLNEKENVFSDRRSRARSARDRGGHSPRILFNGRPDSFRLLCMPALRVLLSLALAAAPGTPEGSAGGVRWTVPAGWQASAERPMRVATYTIPAASGGEAGECGVFFFGRGQGGS